MFVKCTDLNLILETLDMLHCQIKHVGVASLLQENFVKGEWLLTQVDINYGQDNLVLSSKKMFGKINKH